MGMTAPALYRYFGSREDLLQHVCGDIFTEIAADIHAAIDRAAEDTGGDMTAKMIAPCSPVRRRAPAHPPAVGVALGPPPPGREGLGRVVGGVSVVAQCADKFSRQFLTLFFELWTKHPFPAPADSEIDPGLLAQLIRYRDALGADLPAGAVLIFLRCWVRLYGMVTLEVFD